jgi:hypothetical protein
MSAIRLGVVAATATLLLLATSADPSGAFNQRQAASPDPSAHPAARPYYEAATKGDADAQANLGALYAKGNGVPQSHSHALQWFMRAAEQGHAGAQMMLSGIFANGKGVRKDNVLAYKWAALAAANAADAETRDDAEKMLALVARQMSQAQIAEGRMLTEEWTAKPSRAALLQPATFKLAAADQPAPPAQPANAAPGADRAEPAKSEPAAKPAQGAQPGASAAEKPRKARRASWRGAQASRWHRRHSADPISYMERRLRAIPLHVRSLLRSARRIGF